MPGARRACTRRGNFVALIAWRASAGLLTRHFRRRRQSVGALRQVPMFARQPRAKAIVRGGDDRPGSEWVVRRQSHSRAPSRGRPKAIVGGDDGSLLPARCKALASTVRMLVPSRKEVSGEDELGAVLAGERCITEDDARGRAGRVFVGRGAAGRDQELPDDLAQLDRVLSDQLLLFPIAQAWAQDARERGGRRSRWPRS